MSAAAAAHAAAAELGTTAVRSEAVSGGCISECVHAYLDDGSSIIVKANDRVPPDFFTAEADGLARLAATGTVRVPSVLGVDERWIALEWIEPGRPAADHDERLGRALAALHGAPCAVWGLDRDNYVGSLPQDNTPAPAGPEFWWARRLEPHARAAHDGGLLAVEDMRAFDRLRQRLVELWGPAVAPSVLHGDLWAGNVHTDASGGPCVLDPSVYGGHREVDLAMLRLFGGPGRRCFDAYEEASPLPEGHEGRVPLWQLYPLLVHVRLFGAGYVAGVRAALATYA